MKNKIIITVSLILIVAVLSACAGVLLPKAWRLPPAN